MTEKRLLLVFCRVVCLSALALASGCGSKGAVSLTAHLDNPAVTATSVALGTSLSGGFDLVLELGSEAPESTAVSVGTFSIKNEAGIVVDSLAVSPDQSFPVSIAVGASKSVHFTLDATKLVESSTRTSLCTGAVSIAGTVTDSLNQGKPTPVSSSTFTATCPD